MVCTCVHACVVCVRVCVCVCVCVRVYVVCMCVRACVRVVCVCTYVHMNPFCPVVVILSRLLQSVHLSLHNGSHYVHEGE